MAGKDDAMDKISKMVEERINAAFEGREQKEREEKDPWAKLEGIVDRAVAKHFEALGAGVEEEKAKTKKSKSDDGDEKILGGIFG
jgi:hypothetical protein